MAPFPLPIFLLPFSFLIITFTSSTTATAGGAGANKPNISQPNALVQTACAHASYPNICLKTLSSYSNQANSLDDLAKAAVKVCLKKTHKISNYIVQLRNQSKKREKDPLRDCVEQIGDSIDELSRTLSELQHLRSGSGSGGSSFKWRMNNAETWVSAALTNEYTCLDGFKESDGKVRSDVKDKITNVARLTSNALSLINCL